MRRSMLPDSPPTLVIGKRDLPTSKRLIQRSEKIALHPEGF